MLRITVLIAAVLMLAACADGPGISKAGEGVATWPSTAIPAPLYP